MGVARPIRRRSRGAPHPAGVRVRAGGARHGPPGGRRRRARRLGARSGRTAARLGDAQRHHVVRADARRPPRDPLAGLPRRAERRPRRNPARIPGGGGEPGGAAAPPPPAGLGGRARDHGRRPRPRRRGRHADLLRGAGPAEPRRRRGTRRTHRGMARRPLPRRGHRARRRRSTVVGVGRRPVRGRLPLSRVARHAHGAPAAIPAPHLRARDLLRPALRCRARHGRRAERAAGARGVQRVPGAARSPPGLVPLPRALPRVPARRPPPRRARRDHRPAPGGGGVVRGARVAGHGGRAPARHLDRAHAGDAARGRPDAPDLPGRTADDRAAMVHGSRHARHRGLSAAGRPRGLDDGAHGPGPRGGPVGVPARDGRLRRTARRRLGVLRLRPRDAPRHALRRRTGTRAGRCRHGGRVRADLEPVARPGPRAAR